MARQMKDSGAAWIGEIPNSWKCNRLKYLATYNDEVLDESTNDDFEFDYIDIGSVEYGKGIMQFQHMRYGDAPSRARRIVRKGDVILSTVRTYLKAVATISDSGSPQIASTGFIVLRAKEDKVHPRFLNYAVLSNAFISTVEAKSVGISYPAINASEVVTIAVPVPPLPEQRRIAAFLNAECARIDAVIEQTRVSIEEYKKLKQSVITQAVTKGIRPGRKMKDSGIEWIGEIAEPYNISKLKYVLSTQLQYGANQAGVPYEESLPRYIRITDITLDGRLKESGALSLSEEDSEGYILKDNDVLFARSGATVGKAFIYREEYGRSAFAGYLIKASLTEEYLPNLLFWYTQSSIYEEWKKRIFIQATIQNIGADRYKELPIIIQPIDEQCEIVSYLMEKCKGIDGLIASKETLLLELESYKKSLIFEYVTGKKEC